MWRRGATRLGFFAAAWLAVGASPAWDQTDPPSVPPPPQPFQIRASPDITSEDVWRAGRVISAASQSGAMLTYWPIEGAAPRGDGLVETAVIVAGLGDVEILPVVLKVWRREDAQVVLAYASGAAASDGAQLTLVSPLSDCGAAPHCFMRVVVRMESDGGVTVDGAPVGRVE